MGREDGPRHRSPYMDWIEAALLLVGAPLLMFPTIWPRWTAGALAMLGGWWLLRWLVRGEPWPLTPFNGALLLFALMIAVGICVSVMPAVTLPVATRIILGLATFRVIAFFSHNRRRLALALIAFCLLCLLILALSIVVGISWWTKAPLLQSLIEWLSQHLPRPIAILPEDEGVPGMHPNQMAGVLILYIPLALSLLFRQRGPHTSTRYLLGMAGGLLFFVLLAGTLALTQSRSGWMGGLAGLIVVLALWGSVLSRSSGKWICWGAVIVILAVGTGAVLIVGPERLRNVWEEPSIQTAMGPLNTLAFRQEIWRWALVGIGDFPSMGCGLGTFSEVARVLYPLDPRRVSPDYDIGHAHNIFLQTALDLGIPGLIAYLALLMVAGAICWQVARRGDPLTRSLAIGLAGGLLALHAYGMTDALALGSKPAVAFWYALGLVAALERMHASSGLSSSDR